MAVFRRLKYDWNKVIDVSDDTLSNFEIGQPVE